MRITHAEAVEVTVPVSVPLRFAYGMHLAGKGALEEDSHGSGASSGLCPDLKVSKSSLSAN